MLTSLEFLAPGQQWPPPIELERMQLYHDNRALYTGLHHELTEDAAKRVQSVIGDFEDVISYEVLLNYQAMVSKKTADLLLSEPPTITSEEDATQKYIDALMEESRVVGQCYQVAIDVSRYGDGLLCVGRGVDGQVRIYAGRTDCWYPVVDTFNIKDFQHHVIGIEITPDPGKPNEQELHVEIHSPGVNEYHRHKLEGGVIGEALMEPQRVETGLQGIDVIPVSNITTSDAIHGKDDYSDINSLVTELEVRFAQIAKVLDKHAEPSMQGPEEALEEILDLQGKGTGEYRVKGGSYFVNRTRGEASGNVGYLVWDAQMGAAFTQIDKILGQLRTLSEMGTLLTDVSEKMGQMPTGTALKTLLGNAIAKVARIRTSFDPALKSAIKMAAQLSGIAPAPISIEWLDGLPDDPQQTATIAQIRTGGKPTQSQVSAIMRVDGKTEAEAKAEYERIMEEEADGQDESYSQTAGFEDNREPDAAGGDDE